MAVIIQIRRDTSEHWTSINPVLAEGEKGYETDTGQFKIGDGIRHWTSLGYFADISGKVDKITGSSLVPNTEIAKIHSPGSDNQDLSHLITDTDPRLTDARDPKTHTHTNDHAQHSDDQDLSGLQPKESGKGLSSNDYTTTEKNKLSGIEEAANNYTHPANHAASVITQDTSNRFVSDAEKSTWNGKSDLTLTQVKNDVDIADAISEKHPNTLDHSHSNKSTLDTYDQTNANLTDAVNKKHSNSLDHASGSDAETAATISTIINGVTEKTTPVDADITELQDSASSFAMKKVTWANIKATLKTYFDGLYNSLRLVYTLSSAVGTSGTGETLIFNKQIPAGRAVVGSTFRIRMAGASSSTGTLIFRVKVGVNGTVSDNQVWISTTSAAQVANAHAGFDVLVTVRSSTTAIADGNAHAGAVMLPTLIGAPATAAINTANAWYIDVTCTCSVGTFTAQVGIIEEIR
jgi:hypothetical protein